MLKKSKKLWIDKLSTKAKAEILGGVLHQFEEWTSPKIWNRLPKKLQRLIRRAQHDCSIWHEDLSKKDYKQIREWFEEEP